VTNGAQAHVAAGQSDVFSAAMCGGGGLVQHIPLDPSGPVDTSSETCCGDCMPSAIEAPAAPSLCRTAVIHHAKAENRHGPAAKRRPPLWPGAPPLGPPAV
jgi:hypothetical protein